MHISAAASYSSKIAFLSTVHRPPCRIQQINSRNICIVAAEGKKRKAILPLRPRPADIIVQEAPFCDSELWYTDKWCQSPFLPFTLQTVDIIILCTYSTLECADNRPSLVPAYNHTILRATKQLNKGWDALADRSRCCGAQSSRRMQMKLFNVAGESFWTPALHRRHCGC